MGISGLAWTAEPSSPVKVTGETPLRGLLVRAASGLDFQIPESSLLGPILCLTSLQGTLMNKRDNWPSLKKIKHRIKRLCWPQPWVRGSAKP